MVIKLIVRISVLVISHVHLSAVVKNFCLFLPFPFCMNLPCGLHNFLIFSAPCLCTLTVLAYLVGVWGEVAWAFCLMTICDWLVIQAIVCVPTWSQIYIYKYLDTWLPFLSLATGDPFKLTSPAQHASRWRMHGSQTCRLLHRPRGLARMRQRENRRDREFMLGNSRTKLPDAMHAG